MKLLKKLLALLSIGTFVLAVYLVFFTIQHPGDMPKIFGLQPVKAASGSMEPTFSKGDLLFMKETGAIRIGSVLMYEQNEVSVTHRVTQITEEGFRTKGDANALEDGALVPPEQVKGIYLFHIPSAGWLIEQMAGGYGIITGATLLGFIALGKYYKTVLKVLGLRKKYVRYKPRSFDS
ncbi:signal peptidase I [Salibacterium halotolerans]|uniref:Signal peptidase I n=1 Tax=Salibacterium halotolerans TaxID=1884432 RepID=A0A1I5V631_9BACI|nr:signal peptidase I [Salibacterium halotolerans]SFQ02807.1 signal peptidase, endoplasmic reticulum-type [Salibacterium halotolerans]